MALTYQVFSSPDSRTFYFLVPPALTGIYSDRLQSLRTEDPVIPSCAVPPDIPYVLNRLYESADRMKHNQQTAALQQAFTLIILARSFPCLALCQRKEQLGHNIIYDTVTYMAAHFTEDISLTKMAQDLGYSPFALSRVSSQTFHTNFNRYLNELHLNTALNLLENPEETITDAALSTGFTSLRTFNRVFGERFHMPPRGIQERTDEKRQFSAVNLIFTHNYFSLPLALFIDSLIFQHVHSPPPSNHSPRLLFVYFLLHRESLSISHCPHPSHLQQKPSYPNHPSF